MIVDAQCQAKKPNCFVAFELGIDSIAPQDVSRVTDTCFSAKAFGNCEYFLNKPQSIGGSRNGDIP